MKDFDHFEPYLRDWLTDVALKYRTQGILAGMVYGCAGTMFAAIIFGGLFQ